MSQGQLSQPREVKASAAYERIRDLTSLSPGAQARDIDLVKRVPTNPISRLFQPRKELFVRKTYRFADTSAIVYRYLWSEYEILRTLKHPNIVQYADFECKQQKGRWSASIYMEFCSGGDLSQYTSRYGVPGRTISEKQYWEIFYQLASALLYCHAGLRVDGRLKVREDSVWRRPLLHRDIKPANVVIYSIHSDFIHVKICDFGLAKYQHSTFVGSLVGTLEYMAPEIKDEARNWTPKADIYSLGITMRSLNCPARTESSSTIVEQCITFSPEERLTSVSVLEFAWRYVQDDTSGNTLLRQAAIHGQLTVVNRLLEVGADPKVESKIGLTPLHYAAWTGHLTVVNRLIEVGADPKAETEIGLTPLHEAAWTGHLTVVNRLMEVGADPKAESKEGWTPLHNAARNGHLAVVNRLIEDGADPNRLSNFDISPGHCAAHHGRVEILHQLLHSSGDPLLLDCFGLNILDWASTYPPTMQSLHHLYENYKPTNQAITLLHRAKIIRRVLHSHERTPQWFDWVGRLLLTVGKELEAITALEQNIQSSQQDRTISHLFACEMCQFTSFLEGQRYVCRTCPDTDLCQPCFLKYGKGEDLRNCSGHSFLVIPGPTWKTLKAPCVNGAGETLVEWIERMRQEWDAELAKLQQKPVQLDWRSPEGGLFSSWAERRQKRR